MTVWDLPAQQKVKKAALLYQKGFAVKQICQQIEIKSKSTLYKYLQLENIPLRSFSKNWKGIFFFVVEK